VVNAIEQEIDLQIIKENDDLKLKMVNTEIENIFNKFHVCSRQLRARYSGRSTLDIHDEYDVQDFLHILLRLFFDDIRVEECTPSYAGSSARMDFLIPEHNIVIEVKKTRDTLKDKEIGNQLIEDIVRYKSHPNCKYLYCFVYDPEGLIGNPKGLEKDLSGIRDGITILVNIKP
jgi:hypothetical protein